MITVSDSTPLIHFGTIKRLDILRSMYGQIVITEAVHREVVTEGIAPGRMDANLFGKGDYGNGLTEAKFRLLSGLGKFAPRRTKQNNFREYGYPMQGWGCFRLVVRRWNG
uniref:Uncharacterized protein n=1 Tax=Candidatus Methanogaster sp. ANME-2c ERB4 TaxID=2759911 RepID=A0A7G9YN03_9EURY|nr:hypothetical protein ICHGDBFH_00042 [Methanosarcinales archaeon ANME-2c ERB4]